MAVACPPWQLNSDPRVTAWLNKGYAAVLIKDVFDIPSAVTTDVSPFCHTAKCVDSMGVESDFR